jgi:hypothetical protein
MLARKSLLRPTDKKRVKSGASDGEEESKRKNAIKESCQMKAD